MEEGAQHGDRRAKLNECWTPLLNGLCSSPSLVTLGGGGERSTDVGERGGEAGGVRASLESRLALPGRACLDGLRPRASTGAARAVAGGARPISRALASGSQSAPEPKRIGAPAMQHAYGRRGCRGGQPCFPCLGHVADRHEVHGKGSCGDVHRCLDLPWTRRARRGHDRGHHLHLGRANPDARDERRAHACRELWPRHPRCCSAT